MPNPFVPRPGTTWLTPAPKRPPKTALLRAEQETWRDSPWQDTLPFEEVDRFGLTEQDRSWLIVVGALGAVSIALIVLASLWDRARLNEGLDCGKRLAAQNATQEQIARICGPRREGLL